MPDLNERRRQAVQCRLQGKGLKETALHCGMSRQTVNDAWQRYHMGGWEAVEVQKTGRPLGSGRILSREQEMALQMLVRERMPDELNMAQALWDREAVGDLIVRICDRRLSVRSLGYYLERWGFATRKPLRNAYLERPELVHNWLREHFPVIRTRAKAEGATLHWCDASLLEPSMDSPLGPTSKVVGPGNDQQPCSVISAVTDRGEMRWMVVKGAISPEMLTSFLDRLSRCMHRKVFVIAMGMEAQHNPSTKAWLADQRDRIAVFDLPGDNAM